MKRIVFLSGAEALREGGEFSLIDVIKQIKNDYKILCICKGEGELSQALREVGIKVVFCDLKWSRKFKYFFGQHRRLVFLSLKLKKFSPDLIYSNSGRANPFAARLAKRLKLPLITHLRDLFDEVGKDKFLFRQSNKIIAISNVIANLVRKFNDNVQVIYNGVDPEKFSPSLRSAAGDIRKRLNLNSSFLVGSVGTIAYRKGYFEFARVAKEITRVIPEAKFLVIGESLPGRDYIKNELLEQIRRDGLEDRFIFTGFIPDVAKILVSLDILLFPPRYEAFGRVIIEAFACKVPVISTYSGGPEEIIEHQKDGFLFKNEDIKGMADAVISLYEDKNLYNAISENAYRKFKQMFTIEKAAEGVSSVIEEVLNQKE